MKRAIKIFSIIMIMAIISLILIACSNGEGNMDTMKSTYDLWREIPGNEDKTIAEFFDTLRGDAGKDGKTTYDLWREIPGNEDKTIAEFFDTLRGDAGKDGKTTYDLWREIPGNEDKTITEFIDFLRGDVEGNDEILSDDKSCYFHLSFDDTMACLKNLTPTATYKSVWEEPFLGFLKDLHDTYGAKISLYTYNDVLVNVTDKYRNEFREASSWLKFGIHSLSHSKRFNKATYEEGKAAWNEFVSHIIRITGTCLSVDRMTRLHYWEVTKEAALGMRDGTCGALGFLSSDHTWASYYLTSSQHMYAYNHDHITDFTTSLVFVSTDFRLDWMMPGYTSSNIYRKPTEDTVYKELEKRFTSIEYADTISPSFIVFAHEWQFYNGVKVNDIGDEFLTDTCRFAYDNGIGFDFPQNRSYLPTQGDIIA